MNRVPASLYLGRIEVTGRTGSEGFRLVSEMPHRDRFWVTGLDVTLPGDTERLRGVVVEVHFDGTDFLTPGRRPLLSVLRDGLPRRPLSRDRKVSVNLWNHDDGFVDAVELWVNGEFEESARG